MKVSKLTSCAVGCALAVGLSAVAAQPERQYIGEVGVVNSSPDVDDVKAARQVASEFPLSVEMSGPQGGYQVADELTVMRGDTVVAEIPHAGPFVSLDLLPGKYTLVGSFGDKEISRDVTVAANQSRTLHMVAPAAR